jgi:hypothetical protein
VKQTTLWLLIGGVIILAYVLFHFRRSSSNLEVEPHALEEIEKAKRQ